MHCRYVISRNAPSQRLVSLVGGGESGGMILGKVITDFVHVRHQKKADGPVRFIVDAAGKSIANAEFGNVRCELFVLPESGLRRTMKPFEMVLIHAVFDHLEKITMNDPSAHGA